MDWKWTRHFPIPVCLLVPTATLLPLKSLTGCESRYVFGLINQACVCHPLPCKRFGPCWRGKGETEGCHVVLGNLTKYLTSAETLSNGWSFCLDSNRESQGNPRQFVACHGRPWWLNSDWLLTGIGWAMKLAHKGGWSLWKLHLIQLADTHAWPWLCVISTSLTLPDERTLNTHWHTWHFTRSYNLSSCQRPVTANAFSVW